MKASLGIFFLGILISCTAWCQSTEGILGLKDYYKDYFPIGVAVNNRTLSGDESRLLLREFNSITPENAMKMDALHPREDVYFWRDADSMVNFAQNHHLKIRGHNLCWHEQVPDWMFKDETGNLVTKEVLLKRLKDHITTVVSRYQGKIYAWDVLNEVIGDADDEFIRNSLWYQICGEEYIAKAFEYAHAADPQALLFYNDYNSERPVKRDKIYRLLKKLIAKHVPIHGIGLQAHWSVFEPSEKELREAIELYSSLGLQIHFTELDMSIYPWEKNKRPKKVGESEVLTPDLEQKQIDQYGKIFSIFREYKKNITSVTFWNVSDRYTWLDYYPVPGRKNYPLLFDQQLQRKKAYQAVINFR
ncbi:endo-1,4-beta-xylanase [Pedobacter sp. MC2016-24]|uniref:endo-1,4-beta-xylanase n=1 Tax=Pedobacter sp. MC2016-24 TaxID=2780090 RepID=UPI00187F7F31|nr:endo-1,4-beta-xylanase [Pedobacter sp. MC2016-24]MBE9601624.1 endo-1,4-beta-xylanase [Pedobacter sp. MC2016-24]